jgi:polygalacturonase
MKRIFILLGALQFAAVSFAAEKTPLNVRDFGATGDGVTKDTVAIQKTLDACAAAGGGTVTVPDGIYLTGSLTLGANTTLNLAGHASLVGSSDVADYPLVNVRWEGEFREGHRALLAANHAANVAITGGTIFGPPISLSQLRNPRGPVLIELTDCTNALLADFTTQYQRLWSIHLLFCKNLTARNLTIRTVNSNGDGIDVDSCDGVTIEHCDINTGDDAISLKSGRGLAAQNLSRPAENIVIRDCRLQSSIFAAIGFGTEMSGGIRNVKIENCVLGGRQNAIFIKSREGRGGYMEDISGDNLTVLKSPTFIGIDLLKKGIQATDPVPGDLEKWPRVRNLSFTNVRVQDVTRLVTATNISKERPLDGFALADISGVCSRGISLANMTNVNLSKINVTGFSGPLVTTENVQGTGPGLPAARYKR